MFQPTRPDATIPFMEAESKTCNKRGQPENPFLLSVSLSPRVLLIAWGIFYQTLDTFKLFLKGKVYFQAYKNL